MKPTATTTRYRCKRCGLVFLSTDQKPHCPVCAKERESQKEEPSYTYPHTHSFLFEEDRGEEPRFVSPPHPIEEEKFAGGGGEVGGGGATYAENEGGSWGESDTSDSGGGGGGGGSDD